jgi:hypothetical protein
MKALLTPRRLALLGAGALCLLAAPFGARVLAPARAARAAAPRDPDSYGPSLRVPRASGPIALDGDTDDPGWQRDSARTGAFLRADGAAARPHSEARFVWADGYLYVELYAADEDITARHDTPDGPVWSDDSFHLVFNDGVRERSFDLSANGTLTDGDRSAVPPSPGAARPFDYSWSSGAHVSHDVDGTPNVPGDDDEEWVIEMAIPLESIGLKGEPGERTSLWMRRCDTPKSGERACGSWGEGAAPGELVLE